MRWFIRRFTCAEQSAARDRGASAILVAMGTSAAMLLVAATIGMMAKHELRMSRAEAEATQSRQLVLSEFDRIAARAWDVSYIPNDDGTTQCAPTTWPGVCPQVLRGHSSGSMEWLPVRITFQYDQQSDRQSNFGWVERTWSVDRTSIVGVKVYHYYFWCPEPAPAETGPCRVDS